MSALRALSWIIAIKSATSQTENVCVFGRDGVNTEINGEFIFMGYFNSRPWYQKQYGDDIMYMFSALKFAASTFIISDSKPRHSASWQAICEISTSYPYECGFGHWSLGSIDPNVYCQIGSCPEWNCDAIITDIEYKGCDDVFPVKVGTNIWSNINGDRFFYFNYLDFRWTCDESLTYTTYTTYPISLLAYAEQGWIDATKGSTVSLHFVEPFDQTQQIQCVENTDEPTAPPTDYPTLFESTIAKQAEVHDESTTFSATEHDATSAKHELTLIAVVLIAICGTLCIIIIVLIIRNIMLKEKESLAQERKIASDMRPQQKKKIDADAIQDRDNEAIEENKHEYVENAEEDEKKDGEFEHEDVAGENNEDLVYIWLNATVGLPQYYATFIKNGYNSLDFISNISTKEDLNEIGIKIKGHQTQLMAHIQTLKDAADENEDEDLYEEQAMQEIEGVNRNATNATKSETAYVTNCEQDTSGHYDA